MVIVTTERELAQALKRNEDTITIEGALAKKVARIKGTSNTAWALAVAAISVAVGVTVVTAATGGLAAPVALAGDAVAAPAAVAIIGLPATLTAISIAASGGGVGALSKVRKYKVREKQPNRLVISK